MAIAEENALLLAARQIPSLEARRLYIEQVGQGNAELRGRIEALLRADNDDRSFLQPPDTGH